MKLIFFLFFCSFLCIMFAEKSFQDDWFVISNDDPTLRNVLENLKYDIFHRLIGYKVILAKQKNYLYFVKLRGDSAPNDCEVTLDDERVYQGTCAI